MAGVKPQNGFKFDMPTGNEGCAWQGLWKPGGFTNEGVRESIVTNMSNYNHQKNWTTFVNLFGGSQNEIKIK